jgi:hypothetical protein
MGCSMFITYFFPTLIVIVTILLIPEFQKDPIQALIHLYIISAVLFIINYFAFHWHKTWVDEAGEVWTKKLFGKKEKFLDHLKNEHPNLYNDYLKRKGIK